MTRKMTAPVAMAAAILLALSGAVFAGDAKDSRAGPLRVVTQNLYIGGDIFLPLSVPPEEFPAAAAEVIDQILDTNYAERAMRLADQLLDEKPHLVGLQEASQVSVCFDEMQNACLINDDYLQILLDNLNADRALYREVASVTNLSIENLPASLPDGTDVFVTVIDRDVTLARRDVETANAIAANYQAALPLVGPFFPPEAAVLRGYTAVDAFVLGRAYRFVNTHLEIRAIGSPQEGVFRAIQAAQAAELVGVLAAGTDTQVVVGDFNSDPSDGPLVDCLVPDGQGGFIPTLCPTPYAVLTGAAYQDVWLERRGPFEFGYTCCQATRLDNADSALDERIDSIWVRRARDLAGHFVLNVQAGVIGDEPGDKTVPGGLWPSDHGGVSARMVLRSPR